MIEFRTSSFCTYNGCVEVGLRPTGAAIVRDAKDERRAVAVEVPPASWAAFLDAAKRGEFDRLR